MLYDLTLALMYNARGRKNNNNNNSKKKKKKKKKDNKIQTSFIFANIIFISPFTSSIFFLECVSGSVRLADGNSQTNGRLEVCVGGIWGTVCSQSMGSPSAMARVVCRQLEINSTVGE